MVKYLYAQYLTIFIKANYVTCLVLFKTLKTGISYDRMKLFGDDLFLCRIF